MGVPASASDTAVVLSPLRCEEVSPLVVRDRIWWDASSSDACPVLGTDRDPGVHSTVETSTQSNRSFCILVNPLLCRAPHRDAAAESVHAAGLRAADDTGVPVVARGRARCEISDLPASGRSELGSGRVKIDLRDKLLFPKEIWFDAAWLGCPLQVILAADHQRLDGLSAAAEGR